MAAAILARLSTPLNKLPLLAVQFPRPAPVRVVPSVNTVNAVVSGKYLMLYAPCNILKHRAQVDGWNCLCVAVYLPEAERLRETISPPDITSIISDYSPTV